jgi:hypothetical protein
VKSATRNSDVAGPVAITLVGHICIDENVVDGVAQGQTWGSAVLFAADYLNTRPEARTTIIASYGDDFRATWPQFAVANAPTGHETLLYRNTTVGGVTSRSCRDGDGSGPVYLDQDLRSDLRSSELVVVAPLLANYTATYVESLTGAAPGATFVLLAQGFLRDIRDDGTIQRRPFREQRAVLSRFDVVIVSDDDLSEEWDEALAEATRWSIEHPQLSVVVTRNALGAVLLRNGAQTTFPAVGVVAPAEVRPVGAGDTFGAALSLSFVATGDIGTAITVANAAAAHFLCADDRESAAALGAAASN